MRVVLAFALIAATAACTADESARPEIAAARSAGQCFSAASVNSFNPVGRDAVDVRVGANRIYRLTLGAGCFDVDFAERAVLQSRTGTGFICGAADAELIVPAMGERYVERCSVLGVRRLGEAEIEERYRSRNR